jgi:hypothetical protein
MLIRIMGDLDESHLLSLQSPGIGSGPTFSDLMSGTDPQKIGGCLATSILAQLMPLKAGASMPLCARLTGIELGVKVSCR